MRRYRVVIECEDADDAEYVLDSVRKDLSVHESRIEMYCTVQKNTGGAV